MTFKIRIAPVSEAFLSSQVHLCVYRLILANQVYVNVQMFSFCYYFCIPSFVCLSFANGTGGLG